MDMAALSNFHVLYPTFAVRSWQLGLRTSLFNERGNFFTSICFYAIAALLSNIGCHPAQNESFEAQTTTITTEGECDPETQPEITGYVIDSSQADESFFESLSETDRVVLVVDWEHLAEDAATAQEIVRRRGSVEYFIEVGRCPELADTRPEWMCSLQGHPEWREAYPELPKPGENEIVKNYPWVPIYYDAAVDAHVGRITEIVSALPRAKRIWLNDLQGGPSACGCGHILCRWTADYGPLRTAESHPDDAAARFLRAVKSRVAGAEVIPILTTECEREDKECECGGVECFEGMCWRAWTTQLDHIAGESNWVGIACFYKSFGRDLDRYGPSAGWVKFAVSSVETLPPKRGGTGVLTSRSVALIQGWDVSENEIEAQKENAQNAGGWLVVKTPIDQTWEPKIISFPPEKITNVK